MGLRWKTCFVFFFPAGLKHQDSSISIYRSNHPLFCLRVQNRRALLIIIVFSITPMVMCLAPAYSCAVHSSRAIEDTCAFRVLGLFSFVLAHYNLSVHAPFLPFPVTSLHADILAHASARLSASPTQSQTWRKIIQWRVCDLGLLCCHWSLRMFYKTALISHSRTHAGFFFQYCTFI